MGGAGGAFASLACVRPAQAWKSLELQAWKPLELWEAWRKFPSVVVMSDMNDARLPAVYDAIRFWNDTLLSLGSPFRFGPVTHIAEVVPYGELQRQGASRKSFDWSAGWYDLPPRVAKMRGDVIVALSDGPDSVATSSISPRKVLVVIRAFRIYQTNPPSTLSGAQDTIAHELGHAIGLQHNNDPTSLMCGPCRFAEREGISPLTDDEKELLLKLYPPSWQEQSW
jgi:hypothetical protein